MRIKYSKKNEKYLTTNWKAIEVGTTVAYPSLGYQHTLNFLSPQNTRDENILCYC